MSTVLRRSYLKVKKNVLSTGNSKSSPLSSCFVTFFSRNFGEDKTNNPDFSSSTILMENGLNVQELPVIVRKLKNISDIDQNPTVDDKHQQDTSSDSVSYHLIQTEFHQCIDLRDVFSLLSKCTKITPNIALGAMERIYDLEKNPISLIVDSNIHINLAKGAILDKLLKVVMKTEDTQTIINKLKTVSSFMEPYKYKFCDELLLRVIDNKLSVEQLCDFAAYLIDNKSDRKYSETIDKLWVGFVGKESEINETNIVEMFKIVPGLKMSKKMILTLLEQKFTDLWSVIKPPVMQEILSIFAEEKYSSLQSFVVVGTWLHQNIHALDEDALLDTITKLTRLNYTDDQVEKAVEKYMKLKGSKIKSHVLIVGVLNYCMHFQIRNEHILNTCSEYFLRYSSEIPPNFLKSFIYPFGFLSLNVNNSDFWVDAEKVVAEKFEKITSNDMSSIMLSFIYSEKYPLPTVIRIFRSEYLVKVKSAEVLKKLHLVDTALSLECENYIGPLLPKDQWSKPIKQDARIRNIVAKIMDSLIFIAGSNEKLSTGVLIPYIYSDETYLIDIMLHPAGLGSSTFNWKLKTAKNENTAVLIHLPDHYCSDNKQLIGPQVMRKKHLKLLGMKVVSLKYSTISMYYTSCNISGLKEYLMEGIENAETCD